MVLVLTGQVVLQVGGVRVGQLFAADLALHTYPAVFLCGVLRSEELPDLRGRPPASRL